jgi:23S rRNA (guanosine2251-2'-O)-methyltransferase
MTERRGTRTRRSGPHERGGSFAIGGRRTVTEAIRAGRVVRLLVARNASSTAGLRAALEGAELAGMPVERVDLDELAELGVQNHQGLVALVRLPEAMGERGLAAMEFPPNAIAVVLDGIEDPQNFGACARSAEAAGASVLITRERRSAPLSPAAVRASAGALLHLPVASVVNLRRAIENLKDRRFTVVGLDQGAEASIHDGLPPDRPLALVVGAEGEGISRLVRESCDLLVSIPLAGRTGSLNASAALAVGLFGYAVRAAF